MGSKLATIGRISSCGPPPIKVASHDFLLVNEKAPRGSGVAIEKDAKYANVYSIGYGPSANVLPWYPFDPTICASWLRNPSPALMRWSR
jgi:hypothetical protein